MQRNNLVAVLAISAVVFARPRRAVHGALGGQEVGATAERSESKPECNSEGPERKPECNSEGPERKERVERESGKKSSEHSERESGKKAS